jgi:hypothetical protein
MAREASRTAASAVYYRPRPEHLIFCGSFLRWAELYNTFSWKMTRLSGHRLWAGSNRMFRRSLRALSALADNVNEVGRMAVNY